MAMAISRTNIRLQPVLKGLNARLAALWSGVKESRRRQVVFRRTLFELNSLTNRDLADLAIPRSHIRRLALEASLKDQVNET